MKKILILIIGSILAANGVHAAVQSLPFTDHFAYPQGNLFTVATGVWDAGGNAGAEITVQPTAALIAPSGFPAASSNGVRWAPNGTSRRNMVQFGPISSGELYASFLLNIVTAPSSTRLFACLDNASANTSTPELGIFLNGTTLGISRSNSTPAVTTNLTSGTHLVVVRYTFLAGDDQADLWVDPTNTTYSATNAPASIGSTTGTGDPGSISYFQFTGTSTAGPTLYYDEVRIGTNWADVVPGSPPAPPPPESHPVITQVFATPEPNIVLRGTGGAPTGTYQVVSSTDVSAQLSTWTPIATCLFDASGNFDFTNSVSPSELQRFYRLLIAAPPSITNQPGEQMVHIGQTAVFTVGATGSQLNYQWYFNTTSPLSLATNPVLTINNVQNGDVGGYSVVVSNAAGSVTSVVANLTIGDPVTNGDVYVAANGNDSNDGSFSHPVYSLQKAADLAQPGYQIYIRGTNVGTLMYSATVRLTNSGTALAPIKIYAYTNEHPVLNFSSQPFGDSNRGILVTTNANWYEFKGLEICYAGDNGVKVEGSHHLFEQCVFHHNNDTGLQIGFGHTDPNPGAELAAYITVKNCDSYNNYDYPDGQDADGFAAKLHCGKEIYFFGCRAWYNDDDGWDLFETDASIVISNCWAWKSAYYPANSPGNGNGFKLGGNGTGGNSKGTHKAYNCIAFGCKANGFTNNSHQDGEVVMNCLAFTNGASAYNFFFEGSVNSGKTNIFMNNAGIPKNASGSNNFTVDAADVEENNSWNYATNVVKVTTADFGDVTEAAAGAPRQADGSLPTGFAQLVAGSDLIDKGTTDTGLPYCGTAPDLGAFEYCP